MLFLPSDSRKMIIPSVVSDERMQVVVLRLSLYGVPATLLGLLLATRQSWLSMAYRMFMCS